MMWPGPAYLRDMMTPRRWPSRRLTVHCALSLSFGSPPLKAGRKEPVLVQDRAALWLPSFRATLSVSSPLLTRAGTRNTGGNTEAASRCNGSAASFSQPVFDCSPSLSYPRPGPMNQTPRCAYMLLLVHVTMCLSISNGYMRLLLWLHPVPVHPIRIEMEIFKRNATPAHMQGNKSEDENRDKTETMEMDTICVCCCCFARFICLCGAFPMFPKHYTPSAGCPKHVKLLRSTRCKNHTHSPKTDQ